MIAADSVHGACLQPAPQRVPVGLVPQRRGTDVLGRVGLAEALPGQVQIQRPGLDVDGQPRSPGLLAPVQGRGRGQVHHVDGRAGATGQAHGLVDGLDLGADRPRIGKVAHRAAARPDQLAARALEYPGVLAVHERQGPGAAGRGDGIGQARRPRRVVRIGQEQLHAGVPVSRQAGDLGGGTFPEASEHRVQEPVHRCLGAGACHLPRDRRGHGLAGQRERHVAHGRDAPGDRRQRAGPEIVYPDRLLLAELRGQGSVDQVHVRIDAAGEDEQAIGVELVLPGHNAADPGYPPVPHPDVGDLAVAGSDDRPVADDEVKGRCQLHGLRAIAA